MIATISEKVPLMCQLRKTMQRSVVSQVNSICIVSALKLCSLKLCSSEIRNVTYVHAALRAVVHAWHAVVHVAVVHV